MSKLASAAALLRSRGPAGVVRQVRYRLSERFFEQRLGVDTAGHQSKTELGIQDPDSREYSTVPYGVIFQLLRAVPRDWRHSTFIDYGAGKGRAVVVAATHPFRRVIGVELAPTLVDAARANVGRMRHRKATSVDIVQADAARFEVPADADVIFFYNPFAGRLLEQVVANIRRSLAARPRRIDILYVNDDHFQVVVAGESWLRRSREFHVYPGLRCGIYQAVAGV